MLAGAPRPAASQGFLNLGLGVSAGSAAADGRANFVVDVGWLPREPVGLEVDATYAPRFFKNPGNFTENRLATVMGNVMVAPRARDRWGGFRRGRPGPSVVRPYVSGGFGVMNESITSSDPAASISNQHLGVNAGVGVMAITPASFGLRAEIRYFQDLVGTSQSNGTGIDFGAFHFWRASIGAVVAF
jgi:hypothetical protein